MACHEIGRDGLWVRDWLVAHGIACVVFSPDVLSGNSKTVKTDKVDAARLAVRLSRFFGGELECDHVHLPPSAECQEGRALSRERQFAVAERTRHRNRFLSILARHKEVPPRLDIRKVDVDALRDQLGEPLPPGEVEALRMARRRYLAADADAENVRRKMAKALAGEAKKEKARAKAGGEAAPASPPGLLAMALKLTRLNGIGLRTAWVLVHELFHKEFRNTGQVSSATGLVAVPRSSGTANRCGGVSKRSNGPLRGACVEAAWLWLRHQPGSAISRWFDGRTAQGVSARRMRKVAIVAVARKLAVALWKYLALDIMPEGAVRTGA